LHTCCGPCAAWPARELLEHDHDLIGFFFNPNIHPYQEYQQRLDAARELARRSEFPLLISDGYQPELYFRDVAFHEQEGERCGFCYSLRLQEAAVKARETGCEGFTTSLLISPYQKHELICAIGRRIGEQSGVPFIYHDWRPAYYDGRRLAREYGLYSQRYCGCIFSEYERFREAKQAR